MRHVVNFGLVFAFLTLAATGVMAFLLPFSLVTTRVHIVAGTTTLVLVGLHLAERIPYFQKHLAAGQQTGRARLSTAQLAGIVLLWGGILAAAVVALPPVLWLVDLGYESRHRAQIVRASTLVGFGEPAPHRLLIARAPSDNTHCGLSLCVSFPKEQKTRPFLAVWAETSAGTMIETLHLPQSLAYSDRPEWNGESTPRNNILPIWRNRYTIVSGIKPDGTVDAITAPTNTHGFTLDEYLVPGEGNEFVLCVEVNAPADPNAAWSDPRVGQPSLLYTAYVEVDAENPYTILELTGHGGSAETSGHVQYDLEGFTTAKELIDLILIRLERPDRQLP